MAEFKVNRSSANRKPPKIAKPKPVKAAPVKKKAKWDDKAKRRIIEHFKRELSRPMGPRG